MTNLIIKEDLKFITDENIPWQDFNNKSVLITGASGMIPAYMVKTLMCLNQKGYNIKIYALVRNKQYAEEIFEEYLNSKNFELIVQDVTTPIEIEGDLDYIIHGASKASAKYFKQDPTDIIKSNVFGTYNCLELARKKNVKGFLLISSGAVYGEVEPEKIPLKEDDYGYLNPLETSSCYGESKRISENMCACWHYQYGIPTKIVRPYHVYGPGIKLDDGRIFADFTKNVLNGEDIVLTSDGTVSRSFCYLSDATRAFFTVLLKGKSCEAYNVGDTDCEISMKDLANMVVSLFPEKNLKVMTKQDNESYLRITTPSRGCANTDKIKSLGWEPQIGIEAGFKRMINSFKFRKESCQI